VKVGPQIGESWVITDGLKPGEQVVIEGNGKVADGMPVHPHPAQTDQAGAGPQNAGADSGGKPAASSEGK
jgi:membrane fusion protein (multidrug efflux system)